MLLKRTDFLKAQIDTDKLSLLQLDGIMMAMTKYAEHYHEEQVKKLTIPLVGVAKRKVCSIEETPNSCSYYNRYRGCVNCPKFVEQT